MESVMQSKGQVTLPKQARKELGLKAGDKVVWIRNAQQRWEVWTLQQLLDDLGPSLDQVGEFSRRAKKSYNPRRA